MSHTLERISTITLDHVRTRLDAASTRAYIAHTDIIERANRRGLVPVVPTDMLPLDHPPLPAIPASVRRVLDVGPSAGSSGGGYLMYSHSRIDTSSTPAELVQALLDADAFAAQYEACARDYADATRTAIEDYTATQIDSVRALVSMVAS